MSRPEETKMQFVVPMLESERGWGSKIDGYAGPFDSYEAARAFEKAYNKLHNNKDITPDWYIVAPDPVEYKSHRCDYRATVDD
jgi:hypothetical protein